MILKTRGGFAQSQASSAFSAFPPGVFAGFRLSRRSGASIVIGSLLTAAARNDT